MSSIEVITRVIKARLEVIQKRHNFDPVAGVRQVRPDMARDYGAFKELLNLVEKAELDIPVPYDPAGLTPIERADLRKTRAVYLYFDQIYEARDEWKIGRSWAPVKRAKALQTGNAYTLLVRHEIPCTNRRAAMALERRIRRYLKHYQVRSQWFRLTAEQAQTLKERLLNESHVFLAFPLKKPQLHEEATQSQSLECP